MNKLQAIQALREFDLKGKFVFSKSDLKKIFSNDSKKTFEVGLARLLKTKLLVHACRGVYVNDYALSKDSYTIERIAKLLRRGHYNYVSLESILSEYGVISQIPMDRLTVMTTGREQIYETPYGVIEFVHTKRSVENILNSTYKSEQRPLRIATKIAALRDLKRVGRNINLLSMVNEDE